MRNKQNLHHKYRPASLGELHGQEEVKAVLSASLKTDNIATAYLFSGPKGTGKTSTARIIARELSVSGQDLLEIDAASNRSIDDIRKLREKVNFHPVESDHKIYILDEVHMLTKEAFNSLLKVLEEPPAYVTFILCTTEEHKVLPTVVSRCLHLRFVQPDKKTLREFVGKVLHAEGVEEPGADIVKHIVNNADNSYRNALMGVEKVIGGLDGSGSEPIIQQMATGSILKISEHALNNFITHKDLSGFMGEVKSKTREGVPYTLVLDSLIDQLVASIVVGDVDTRNTIGSKVKALDVLVDAQEKLLYCKNEKAVFYSTIYKHFNSANEDKKTTAQKEHVDNELEQVYTQRNDHQQKPEISSQTQSIRENGNEGKNDRSEAKNIVESDTWKKLLGYLKTEHKPILTLLMAVNNHDFKDNKLFLEMKYKFHKTKLENSEVKGKLLDVLQKITGKRYEIHCTLTKTKKISYKPTNKNTVQTKVKDEDDIYGSYGKAMPIEEQDDKDIFDTAQGILGGSLIE